MHIIRKCLGLALAFGLTFSAWTAAAAEGESWAVYLYLCGSDMETENGSASADILEALSIDFPENVQLVIQTGGAKRWAIDELNSGMMHRLLQSGDDLEFVERIPNASMGHPETFADFLRFCDENYPADRRLLILWDHGGGSSGGICYDQLFDNDALHFDELKEVFTNLYGEKPEEKPFDIIGFDACLMATVDMAGLCAPFADYLVASQEVEPGCGWSYDGFLAALAENPAMDGGELSRIICDTYFEACRELGIEDNVTLSVIDLAKIDDLILVLSLLSFEGSVALADGPANFYAEMGRGMRKADVYHNGMLDLAGFAEANAHLFPESSELIQETIKECVAYQVVGKYRQKSNGIAVFIPAAGKTKDYKNFAVASEAGGSKSFYHLFEPLMTGELSEEALHFLGELCTNPRKFPACRYWAEKRPQYALMYRVLS